MFLGGCSKSTEPSGIGWWDFASNALTVISFVLSIFALFYARRLSRGTDQLIKDAKSELGKVQSLVARLEESARALPLIHESLVASVEETDDRMVVLRVLEKAGARAGVSTAAVRNSLGSSVSAQRLSDALAALVAAGRIRFDGNAPDGSPLVFLNPRHDGSTSIGSL